MVFILDEAEMVPKVTLFDTQFECLPENPLLCIKRYVCPNCGPAKSYKTKGNLSRHLKYECEVSPRFVCFTCLKKFKHKHHLDIHIRFCNSQKNLKKLEN